MGLLASLKTNKIGGLEQAYLDYTRALISRGHEVVAIIAPDAPYRGELEKLQLKIITLKVRGFYDVFAWWNLRKLLKKNKPDLVLAHNGRAIFAAWGALFGLKIPLIGVSHSNNLKYSKKADALLVLTEAMRKRFIKAGYPPEKCAVMSNMIDLPQVRHCDCEPKAWQEAIQKNHDWIASASPRNDKSIGFMGRLSPEKGADILLQAVSILKQKNIAVKLKIGGAGAEELPLRHLTEKLEIAEQVEFCGWVSKEGKADFFAGIDVLCVPSHLESFGLVVLEAWGFGVPVIASEVDGLAEIIAKGETGLLFPKNDAAELAETIEKLLFSEDNLAQKLIANGSKEVTKYGIEEGAKRLEKLLIQYTAPR